jgi:hypothetical protein
MREKRLFEFVVQWDQAINTAFDQDDVKTTGKRRVESVVRVVATDQDVARFALLRALRYSAPEIASVKVLPFPIHLIVAMSCESSAPITADRVVGPEVAVGGWGSARP